MTEMTNSRMILRRVDAQALTSTQVADRVRGTTEVKILQEQAPSTLLVEGRPDQIAQIVGDVSGWKAMAMRRYQVPDPRPRVLKPAS